MRRSPGAFGIARSRWRLEDLRDALPWLSAYSLSGVGRALSRLGVGRKRGRFSLRSPDPEYREKLALVEGALELARGEPEKASVVYGDEFTLFRQPSLGPVWAGRGEEPRAVLSHRANTRQRLSGAMDATRRGGWCGRRPPRWA